MNVAPTGSALAQAQIPSAGTDFSGTAIALAFVAELGYQGSAVTSPNLPSTFEVHMKLKVNGKEHEVEAPQEMPLLWVLRDILGLTGTKYGCGMAQCGACTVHLDGEAVRSCVLPVSAVGGKSVTTIEGLFSGGLHAVQRAWIEADVVQCGYCQPGQIMTAAALLKAKKKPTDAEIDAAMSGNLCRCGTYQRIRAAVRRAAELAGA